MIRAQRCAILALAMALGGAGCLKIDVADRAYSCGAGNACPTGYVCGWDNYCYKPGDVPSQPGPDLAGGTGGDDGGDMALPNIPTSSIPSQANSKVTVTVAAPPLVANGTSSATLTVEVLDVGNQPVSGALVTFTDGDASDMVAPASGMTDGKGHVVAMLSSSTGGQKNVTATVAWVVDGMKQSFDLMASATFNAIPSQLKSSFVISAPPNLIADGRQAATCTVAVADADGNVLPGVKVTFIDPQVRDTFTPPSGPSDAAGKLISAMTSEVGGDKTVKARVEWPESGGTNFFELSATVTFMADPEASNSTISPASGTTRIAADGSSAAHITVVVKDASNTPVPNATVNFAITGGTQAGDTLSQSTTLTDSNGQIAATFSTTNGTDHEIQANVQVGTGFTLRTTIGVDPIPDSSQTRIDLTSSTIAADGTSTGAVTLTVLDPKGLAVSKGVTLSLAADGGASISPSTGTPDATGVFTTKMTSTSGGAKHVTATVSWNVDGSASQFVKTSTGAITFTPVPSPTRSDIVFSPAGVIANRASQVGITVHVRDYSGTAMAGQSVSLSATGAGNTTIQPVSAPTDGNGAAQTTMVSDTPGDKNVTLLVGGAPLTSATYTFAPVKVATLAFSPHLPVPPNTVGTTFDVGILADDQDGHPLTTTQATVNISLDQTGVSLSGTTSVLTSTTTGIASFHLTINTPGTYTLTAQTQNADGSVVKVTSDQFQVAKPTLTTPTITSIMNAASSITVTWSEPDPATCVLQRADNGSNNFSTPPTLTCSSATSCTDPYLRRGSYVYRVACTPTGGGSTVFSAPSAPQQPGTEVCVSNGPGNTVTVHALNGGTDTVVRTVSAQLNNPWGVTFDGVNNEVFVANLSGGTVTAFDRTATGSTAQPKRTLTIAQVGQGGTGPTQPAAVLVDNGANELIVLERNSAVGPTIAGYPRTANATDAPSWYVQGAATGLSSSYSLASDGTTLWVSNAPTSTNTITAYSLAALRAATPSAANHAVAPSATITGYSLKATGNASFISMRGLQVDPTNHLLFVADSSPASVVAIASSASGIGAAAVDPPLGGPSLSGISGPFAIGFLPSDGASVPEIIVLSRTNGNVGFFPESASGDVSPSPQFNVGANVGGGVAICN